MDASMSGRGTAGLTIVGGIAVLAGLEVAVTGIVLARDYRPTSGVDLSVASAATRRAETVREWHEVGLLIAVVATLAAVVMLAVAARRRRRRADRPVRFVFVAPAVALVAAVGSAVTWPGVQWDQLALWTAELDPDGDLYGWWFAAFGDEVRFVLLDHAEVSQGDYAVSAVAHVALPFVAVAGLLGSYVPLLTHRHGDACDRGQDVGTTATRAQ